MAGYEEGRGGVSLKHIPYAVRKSLIYQPLKFLGFYTSNPPALSPLPLGVSHLLTVRHR